MATWQNISEPDTIVEYAEHNIHAPACLLLEIHRQLIIVVAHLKLFTPGLCPGLVLRCIVLARHPGMVAQHAAVELEAEVRGSYKYFALIPHSIIRFVGLHTDGHRHGAIG